MKKESISFHLKLCFSFLLPHSLLYIHFLKRQPEGYFKNIKLYHLLPDFYYSMTFH
jgi:hypothetical protein